MPSKSKKLEPAEIAAFEATQDIGAEILQSIKDMKAGKGRVVVPAAVEAHDAHRSAPSAKTGVAVNSTQESLPRLSRADRDGVREPKETSSKPAIFKL